MGYFLIGFLIGGEFRVNVLIHTFEDESILEAWLLFNKTFLDEETDHIQINEALSIACESDDVNQALMDITHAPSHNPTEIIKIVEIIEVSDTEYADKLTTAQQLYADSNKDRGLYLLSSLDRKEVTLAVELEDNFNKPLILECLAE